MSRWTAIAVVVPVLGLAVLIGRAEYKSRHGATWTIPIEGYDPRDLLHGQYLQYQYRFHWRGQDSCGEVDAGERKLTAGCCLCLVRDDDGFDPFVHQVLCGDESVSCDSRVQSVSMMPPRRYFIPEDRGGDLENALRNHDAALELTVSPDLEPAVGELMLDRKPWRDVIGR